MKNVIHLGFMQAQAGQTVIPYNVQMDEISGSEATYKEYPLVPLPFTMRSAV